MSNRSCLAFLAILSSVVSVVAAQSPGGGYSSPCLPFEPDNTIVWPSSGYGSAAGFGRIVLADLDGDDAAEGVVLASGVAVMLKTVAVYDSPHLIQFPPGSTNPSNVADLATLHGAGPNGTDGVLMTDSRGLFLVKYSGTAFQAPVVIGSSAWVNASPLHVEDLDHDGDEDVLGVSANHRSILRLLATGSGFLETTITLPYDVLDVVSVDWNRSGDDVRELVALTRRGLYVYEQANQTLQQVVTYLALTGCITRFAADVDCGERLAWVRSTSATTSELVVIAQDQPPVPPSLSATPLLDGPWTMTLQMCGSTPSLQPLALLAGNYDSDEDGNEDLLVVHEANKTALMLRNKGSAAHYFAPSDDEYHDVISLASMPSGAGNVGLPAFEQLDDYGPDDLVFPVAVTGKIEVFLGLPFYRADPLPFLTQPYNSAGIIRREEETMFGPSSVTPSGDAVLAFAFEVPASLSSYTHIQMTIWRQTEAGAAVEVDALYHAKHLLDRTANGLPGNPFQWIEVGPLPPENSAVFANGICWGNAPYKTYYYTEFRFLLIDSNNVVQARSRIFAGGFTMTDCNGATNFGNLTSVGIPNSKFDLLDLYLEGDPGSIPDRTLLGAFVPMSRVPYFNDEVNPNPGTLRVGPTAQPYTPNE